MIESLITSKTRIKLLLKFFLNSQNVSYLRNLENELGESSNGIRLELNRFEKAGLLNSFTEGNRKFFQVNTSHPLFKDLHKIILKVTGLEYVVDYILERIGDLEEVYLVGKLAQGIDSGIIDLVLVGKNINKPFLMEQIEKAEKKVDRKIRFVLFEPEEFSMEKIMEADMHPLLLWKK